MKTTCQLYSDALAEYNTDSLAAEASYGPINTWNVSGLTTLAWVFCGVNEQNASWHSEAELYRHSSERVLYYSAVLD